MEEPLPRDPILHGLGSLHVHLEFRDLLVAHGCVLGMLDRDHADGIAKETNTQSTSAWVPLEEAAAPRVQG